MYTYREDIPIKYKLGAHRLMDDYPNADGVLYDLVSFVIYNPKRKTVPKLTDFKITLEQVKSIYGNNLTDEFKDKLKNILSELVTNSSLSENDGKLVASVESVQRYFKIQ